MLQVRGATDGNLIGERRYACKHPVAMTIPPDHTISTARCTLRGPSEADFPHVQSALQVPGFNDGLAFGADHSIEGLRRMLARNRDNWQRGRAYAFTFENRASGAFLGRVALRVTPEPGRWNLAFWTHPDHQGHGYVTEASRAVVTFGFEVLGIETIEAGHVAENKASRRVLEKLGMKEEGWLERGLMKDGAWIPGYKMAIKSGEQLHEPPTT